MTHFSSLSSFRCRLARVHHRCWSRAVRIFSICVTKVARTVYPIVDRFASSTWPSTTSSSSTFSNELKKLQQQQGRRAKTCALENLLLRGRRAFFFYIFFPSLPSLKWLAPSADRASRRACVLPGAWFHTPRALAVRVFLFCCSIFFSVFLFSVLSVVMCARV